MCIVNTEKKNYELVISDLEHFPICSIYFASISTVCRFLDEIDFDRCLVDVFRCKDMQFIDSDLLKEIWRNGNEIQN